MNFTFKTNREGLSLGTCGPRGLRAETTLPRVAFAPAVFMVADAEDEEAHRLLIQRCLGALPDPDIVTDAYMNFSCLQGAEKEVGDRVYLHRCLLHAPQDVEEAAKKKDRATGKTLLLDLELLPLFISLV
eukprot:2012696-Pyramimonas_sp.AAC.1